MVFDIIKGALGGAGAGSAFGPWGAGVGALLGGVSSLGGSSSSGGGSGGYGGGGGGFSMADFELTPEEYSKNYVEKMFGITPRAYGFTADDPDSNTFADTLISGIDNNKLDKYQAFNQLGASGLNMQDPDLLNSKAYGDLLTDTVGKAEGKDMSAGFSKLLYGNEGVTNKEQEDIYDLAQSLGKTGSTQDLSNFTTAYMAQTAKGLRNRMLSPDEQALATRYGSADFDDKGSMFFTPSKGQKRRGDRVRAFEDALYKEQSA